MSRRQFLGAGAALSAAALGPAVSLAGTQAPAPRRKPNIIYILADDLGYGDVGCYGQTQIKTPSIDRMAREGIRFTDFYAGSTVCAPSRCCLMTGYHSGHARIRGNKNVPLRPEDRTLAEVLKEAGYYTGIIGKWGMGEPGTTGIPTKQGFDYWFGYLNQTHAHYYYTDYLWRNEEKVSIPDGQYSHDLFTKEALEFVDNHSAEPFFLYLAYTIPHAFNEGTADGNGMPVPSQYPYADKSWPKAQKNHAAMITRMDRDIGKLLERLKKLGIDNDTVVMFTSDNGPHKEGGAEPDFFDSNGQLRGIKRDLYDGGIRVPMAARWPGVIKPGQTSRHIWANWDILPTLAAIAGGKAPEGIDGLSMLPALKGQDAPEHEFLYWEFHERGFGQAVRMGRWKAVRNDKPKPIELYDLDADIGETNDLASKYPEIVKKAERIMETSRTYSEQWPGTPKQD